MKFIKMGDKKINQYSQDILTRVLRTNKTSIRLAMMAIFKIEQIR